ncbi:MAG: dTMP kinase [Myxococcota bacterium]
MEPSAKTVDQGIFYVVEGIDGAGSSTQARLLHEHLLKQGHRAHLTCEPTSMPIGKLLRAFLRSEYDVAAPAAALALLFAADRMQHVAQEIVPALQKGEHVVCDRYVLSSLVYQGQQLPLSWVQQLNQHAVSPDVTILIDTASNEAEKRRRSRSETQELFDNKQLQSRLQQRYCQLLSADGIRVDGNGSCKQVFHQMLQALDRKGWLPKPTKAL